ncbi:MAG: Stp1/IreP family PP2C-type Ser/Thr phosphatase [bacterium]
MKLVCAGMTDVGSTREHNEDDFYLSEGEEALCVVADGMGGHRSGEVASAMAIRVICEYYRETSVDGKGDEILVEGDREMRLDEYRLVKAIRTANRAVFQAASSSELYRGMGTTIVSGFFTDQGVYLAHIGDSRVYRFRGDKLEQQTEDHSLANEYVRMGILKAEDVEHFPYKNVITRACGLTDEVEVDISYREVSPGDLFIFCSDGLSDMVNDREIAEAVRKESDLEALARDLIDRANHNGGADNITVILARVEE